MRLVVPAALLLFFFAIGKCHLAFSVGVAVS